MRARDLACKAACFADLAAAVGAVRDRREAACRALEELQQTRGTPKKRSRSLLEKIKGMIAYYDTAMAYDSWLSSQSELDFAMMSSGAPFFTQYHSH